jgi:DMSO/TMAO reductase YedYZ molybdopterin-dependent catalytic subunit
MAGRRTNLALFGLLAAAFLSGTLAFAIGTAWWNRWVVLAHGIAGLAIVVLAPWKSLIARRGLRRARSGRGVSLAFSLLVTLALVAGFLHSTGLAVMMGPVSAMQVHVGAALLALPLALWHVVARRVLTRRADLSRRNLLRAGLLIGVTGLAYAAVEGVVRLASLPGGARRFTGSHERGSFEPSAMPVTQWLDDPVPRLDAGTWRLEIRDSAGSRHLDHATLAAFDDRVQAVLDCTGGWYAEQEWEGAWLDRLVAPAGDSRSLLVRSATGYTRRFPLADLPHLLLATRVGGEPLEAGHGFPARLVAPGRRGFWWVKWVVALEVDGVPWWWQPPFPLT